MNVSTIPASVTNGSGSLPGLQSVEAASLPPLFGWPEELEILSGPGLLVPSAMTAGQGLGTWP